MTENEVFKSALWLGAPEPDHSFYFLRGSFEVRNVKKAVLRAVGLGFFECFINGKRVSGDRFMPLNTDFEPRKDYPVDETLTGHRLLVPEYDVTELIRNGKNSIAIHFGGGWYDRPGASGFGFAKAVWRVFGTDENGEFDFFSSTADRISESYITEYDFIRCEAQDLRKDVTGAFADDFDDSAWPYACPAREPDTDYCFSDCPGDRVCDTVIPVRLGGNVYDCGVNLTGSPVLRLFGAPGEEVTVYLAEELSGGGELAPEYIHEQRLSFVCDGKETEARALFTWFGFRYFSVDGPARPLFVEEIHTPVKRAAQFSCDNETLTWFENAYVTTQLMNMHAGIPSDCPHKERRGYTGDGELVCHAAMTALDAEAFYRKWIRDVMDCQDLKTGHVQYTAPYIQSGGGPGGWGCAIVEVPYRFYLHYGDISVLEDCYPQMLRYFDYLESHSLNGLIVSDKEGEWCLGDWCTPQTMILPPPFVNNYFYIKSLSKAARIAALIGRDADIPLLNKRIEERKNAVMAAYYDPLVGDFLGCRQGANAFAVDIGLGDERAYSHLVKFYRDLGGFDTGIFGTDIVTRVLFEHGDGDLAVRLLTSESVNSFAAMKNAGATTLWEYFPGSLRDRSHSHPMFGAAAAYLYDHILGIRQPEGKAGYTDLEISPCFVSSLSKASGHRELKNGRVDVSWERRADKINVSVTLTSGVNAVLLVNGRRITLSEGKNDYSYLEEQ